MTNLSLSIMCSSDESQFWYLLFCHCVLDRCGRIEFHTSCDRSIRHLSLSPVESPLYRPSRFIKNGQSGHRCCWTRFHYLLTTIDHKFLSFSCSEIVVNTKSIDVLINVSCYPPVFNSSCLALTIFLKSIT